MTPGAPLLVALALAVTVGAGAPDDEPLPSPPVLLTPDEIALARELSPLPAPPPDRTNAWADDPDAARLGQALFFDERLSRTGTVSCATCHRPEFAFTDRRSLSRAIGTTDRHAPTVLNVGHQRWLFWDGRKDTLWSQALAPFEDDREHDFSRLALAHVIADDPAYAAAYEATFGELPPLDDATRFPPAGRPVPDEPEHPLAVAWASLTEGDREAVERVFVNAGKAIAAYERRLVTSGSPFDRFVQGLDDGDPDKLAALTPSAQRGFQLFIGRGGCLVCHDGPLFTDLEFHSNRIPVLEYQDPGRAMGLQRLREDPFNSASRWADDGGRLAATRLSVAPRDLHFPGDFKTPGLRNVALTPPYMHDGRFSTLADVLRFYSTLEGAPPLHPSSERIVQPRDFDAQELADLEAFLVALTDDSPPAHLLGPP